MAASLSLQRTILECQPFLEGAATLVCVGCFKMLTFPNSAKKIKCGNCATECSGVKIRCTSCKEPLQVQLGSTYVRCRKCDYQFQPMASLKIAIPEWAKGSAAKPLELHLKVDIDASVGGAKVPHLEVTVVPTQPIRTCALAWEEDSGADFHSVGFYKGDMKLDAGKSCMELGIVEGDLIEVRRAVASKFGHDFITSQFGGPTNCAQCKTFIWGIYHQGKKCSRCGIPVHHRCAEQMSTMCEADRRQMFGIVNFNDGDDEENDNVEAVVAVVVDDRDKAAFAACVQEAVAPECDSNFMKSLNKISNFTDEQIQEMWLHYDTDSSGSLELDEMKLFLSDLVGAGGGNWTSDPTAEAAADRLMRRMDTNGDGSIQWEEFWYFFKAQQDEQFLSQFKGVTLTQEQLYDMWYHYDADGSGFLELDELLALLGDLQSFVDPEEAAADGGASASATAAAPMDPAAKKKAAAAKYRSRLASMLKPDAQVSWDDFYKTIVPAIKLSLQ